MNNLSPFCSIESKSIKSQKCGSLNKVELIDIAPYLALAWWWLVWTTLRTLKLPILFDSILYVVMTMVGSYYYNSINSLYTISESSTNTAQM